ncbi:hypothetical protein GDO86_018344 [Hymenochirus boettgeri]|uniref:Uncharacterized protein n=1 Tax=Hymenochirus boettgeri TaxID=247094 RepID=A0A8T2IDB5_9PIPI|nr:hypothetical protein GDO86_018344 [Hymenochirus boettgeri]
MKLSYCSAFCLYCIHPAGIRFWGRSVLYHFGYGVCYPIGRNVPLLAHCPVQDPLLYVTMGWINDQLCCYTSLWHLSLNKVPARLVIGQTGPLLRGPKTKLNGGK